MSRALIRCRTGGRLLALALAGVLLTGCFADDEEDVPVAPQVRPVRTMTITGATAPERGPTFSGRIEAADHVAVAFRIGGRLSERLVEMGTTLAAGDPVARLEPQNERTAVRSAEAALVGAEAAFVRADNAFGRHRELLRRGVTSQAYFEGVQQVRTAAEAQVVAAQAQLAIANDRLGFNALYADADGVVTAIGAEPGEVVGAGQMIARVAREGGRDGVFDVPAQALDALGPDTLVRVTLPDDPAVSAMGRVREVTPQADPVTRTFRVRVGLSDPPDALRLGASVSGAVIAEAANGIAVPVAALREEGGTSAVWVVNPATATVSLRPVEIAARGTFTAWIASGLSEGDIVVTAGAGVLHDGQQIRLSGAQS